MIATFILKNIAARVLPGKIPPYFAFQDRMMQDISGYNLDSMSDEQLADMIKANALGIPMRLPLEMKTDDGDWWLLPFEPLISIEGRNAVIKKQISKGKVRGTVKERWTQNDYSINIEGVLMNTGSVSYPSEDVHRLRTLCEAAKLQVSCPLFEIFSISQIVVESFNFPFTAGAQNQAYTIKAVSDDIYQLLLKKEDLKQQ